MSLDVVAGTIARERSYGIQGSGASRDARHLHLQSRTHSYLRRSGARTHRRRAKSAPRLSCARVQVMMEMLVAVEFAYRRPSRPMTPTVVLAVGVLPDPLSKPQKAEWEILYGSGVVRCSPVALARTGRRSSGQLAQGLHGPLGDRGRHRGATRDWRLHGERSARGQSAVGDLPGRHGRYCAYLFGESGTRSCRVPREMEGIHRRRSGWVLWATPRRRDGLSLFAGVGMAAKLAGWCSPLHDLGRGCLRGHA